MPELRKPIKLTLPVNYWDKFLSEAVDLTGPTNFRYDFPVLTKKYGKAFKEYVKLAYFCKDELTDEDFCNLNHLSYPLLQKFLQ